MPIIVPIAMFLQLLILGTLGYLGFKYTPGVMVCFADCLGMLTIFWAISKFWDEKYMRDAYSKLLHVMYCVCIVMLWWNFANMTVMYMETGDITSQLHPSVMSESSSDWFVYIAKFGAICVALGIVFGWVLPSLYEKYKWRRYG